LIKTRNFKKTVCMVFTPKRRDKNYRLSRSFPVFTIGGILLQYVSQFKYLEHVISDNFTDEADI